MAYRRAPARRARSRTVARRPARRTSYSTRRSSVAAPRARAYSRRSAGRTGTRVSRAKPREIVIVVQNAPAPIDAMPQGQNLLTETKTKRARL